MSKKIEQPPKEEKKESPEDLVKKTAENIVRSGFNVSELNHINSSLHRDILLKTIEMGDPAVVLGYMELDLIKPIDGLDKEVALKILEATEDSQALGVLGRSFYKFNGLDKEVALKMMEKGREYTWYVKLWLKKFEGIDEEVMKKIKEAGY